MSWEELGKTQVKIDPSQNDVKLSGSNVVENIKVPGQNFISFENSPLNTVFCVQLAYDGYFYMIDKNYTLEKRDTLIDSGNAEEKGITWNDGDWGEPNRIVVTKEGIIVFSTYDDNGTNRARIYHLDDLQDESPDLIYESTGKSAHWASSNTFGIKSYHFGLTDLIIAGVYGFSDDEKDLLLSTDGGASFSVIKTTKGEVPGTNSHWHDVAYDSYHGFIWASEGDGANQALHFSDDLGSTWRTINAGAGAQPTAILPFPNKVCFARDSLLPGIDVYEKPILEADYSKLDENYKAVRDFRIDLDGSNYFGCSPVVLGQEGYIGFDSGSNYPATIMGTGDGGKTFHFLTAGVGAYSAGQRVYTLFAIDNMYLYGLRGSGYPGNRIVIAKRPSWVNV
jgi:hypothetical protein